MSMNLQFGHYQTIISTAMSNTINRQSRLKRCARLILGLFVLSLMNMGIQAPAHGVMLQTMDSVYSEQHQGMMMQMDLQHCECPPVLCKSVVSLDDQLIDSLHMVSFAHLTNFCIIYITAVEDIHHQQVSSRLSLRNRLYRQNNPPTLSITSILHL